MKTDTVTVYGIELEVNYDFYKSEPSTRDYPGSWPEVEIQSVHAGGEASIYDLLHDSVIEKIEEKLIEINK
jgi:hypothetical protein